MKLFDNKERNFVHSIARSILCDFNVLQHIFVNSSYVVKKSYILRLLKTSDLVILFKFSYKKVARMFGQFV